MNDSDFNILSEVRRARERISRYVRSTPLENSGHYTQKSGAEVFLKLENLQHTGSFKVRGALNKMMSLEKDDLGKGVVTASTGNHGAAVAFAARALGSTAIVFVSRGSSESKIGNIKRLGAEVRFFGDDPNEAEQEARRFGKENSITYVSPYNDPLVVAGQGTLAIEMLEELDRIDAVFISVGGGGLISGIGGYMKSIDPGTEIIGCSPENSKVMIESIKQGGIVNIPSLPTLSDGTAGGIDEDSVTFELCSEYVDEFVTVTEGEIRESLVEFIDTHHMLIEGAAAVAIASFLKSKDRFEGKNVVIVLCGANIGVDTLREVF